jgi:hypothetical protein
MSDETERMRAFAARFVAMASGREDTLTDRALTEIAADFDDYEAHAVELGDSWFDAELAMPEGWSGPHLGPTAGNDGWHAWIWRPWGKNGRTHDAVGSTPAAALRALAVELRAHPGTIPGGMVTTG